MGDENTRALALPPDMPEGDGETWMINEYTSGLGSVQQKLERWMVYGWKEVERGRDDEGEWILVVRHHATGTYTTQTKFVLDSE